MKKYKLGDLLSKAGEGIGPEELMSMLASGAINSTGSLINTIGDSKTPTPYPVNISSDANPYLSFGGAVKKYSGNSHENGGIPIDSEGNVNPAQQTGEVEGKEIKHTDQNGNDYVFSHKLGIAQEFEKKAMKIKKSNPQPLEFDQIGRNAIDQLAIEMRG